MLLGLWMKGHLIRALTRMLRIKSGRALRSANEYTYVVSRTAITAPKCEADEYERICESRPQRIAFWQTKMLLLVLAPSHSASS